MVDKSEADRRLIEDLEAAGFSVLNGDLWLLKPDDRASRVRAFPTLVEHLERGGLSVMNVAAVATLLSNVSARPYFERVAMVFQARGADWARNTLAGTLAATAGREQLAQLERLFAATETDASSSMFVRPLLKLARDRWEPYFRANAEGAVWAVEAVAALKGRARND